MIKGFKHKGLRLLIKMFSPRTRVKLLPTLWQAAIVEWERQGSQSLPPPYSERRPVPVNPLELSLSSLSEYLAAEYRPGCDTPPPSYQESWADEFSR